MGDPTRPLRVLHVNSGNLYGGVETVLVTLAAGRHLCPEMEPEFAVCFEGRQADELRKTGARVHVLGPARVSRPWTVLKARRALAKVLRDGAFDAVDCHQPWVFGLFGGVVVRSGAAAVWHYHNSTAGGWVERLGRRHRPALVLAPSEHTLRSVSREFPGVPGAAFHNPLPPGVTATAPLTPAERTAVRAELGAGPGDVIVLQASRLERWKGPDVVIRALGPLRDVPGWRFWFAGGAQKAGEVEYLDELRRAARDERIEDRVHFLGARTDVPRLMRAADVYAQGNRGPESFGLSFLEASYSGLPAVTFDLGGVREVIDPASGVLVQPGDTNGFTDALRRLIADPKLRTEMGERASQKAVERFDLGRQLNRLRDLLAGMRSDGSSRPMIAGQTGAGRRA
ncbi:glycosyl transferase family 1 : Group 1 glycosyl transferase OS=Corallococcus coralloides (strain ATCC 25202 / DSM 2259 / NBRC 100086 / M2) GN=mshA2 PE=4 SV=1: Glycos_transf_1 [Gemmataceae bacterium]|nr:glycosyl transferase family 1 : Group 1 glycosyl transferase OS=Corallococcus coralloides (strain ATCC 25202 / DSM 2259 / NBRC 100086 / M2) GN=mshA2 PE=4 SV=1: Glycos_transf_1 [Gemmataceae bacterium]VTU00944.1 glycosyl transferase family 1 : Group 1 glycosyl transferase OS=Corallococcus coralloides (strain ATCC 25202 / DSM 2259 / NBRC 100086 / M2) GN=mshA2 PE=4 SV=1: Glycos_transf_1 [Gemmataceae bacterium]